MNPSTKLLRLLLPGLGLLAALPRCACDEDPGIERAAVELKLTYVETDSCSGAQIPRRIPDDYESTTLARSTDFGSRGERVFEVRSVGSAPLVVRSVALSEEDPEFTLELVDAQGAPVTLPLSLVASRDPAAPPGLVIRARYAAADEASDLVDLVVVTDDPKRSEVRFGLSAGRGRLEVCGPDGTCGAGAAIAFGNVSQGGEATETLVIRNVGEGDLDLRSLRLTSPSAEFCAPQATELPEGVEDCALVPQCLVLAPGETYELEVRYRPVDGGEDTGAVVIASGDAAAGNVEVPINGRGAGPALCACLVTDAGCVPTGLVDFGVTDVGVAVERTIRLESCGTEPVELTEATLEDQSSNPFFTGPEFQIVQAFPAGSIAPGAHAEGRIAYRPAAGGSHRGGLRYTIAGGLRSWMGLRGAASTCDLEVLPTTVNFGTVAGGSSADRQVILSNNGARACTVTALTDPSMGFAFVNKPAVPFTVAPGGSSPLSLRFSPPTGPVAAYTSTFRVTSDEAAPGDTTTVTLNGQGGGTPLCDVRVTPSGGLGNRDGVLQFGAVNIGYDKILAIRIENVGNTACTLQSATLNTQAQGQFTISPGMLPVAISPGQTAQIPVSFAPTGAASNPFGIYGPLLNHVSFTLQGQGLMKTMWSIGLSARPTEPTIDVLPDEVDFGVVTWERPQAPDNRSACGSATRSINVYNSGSGTLNVTGISIDATSDQLFRIVDVRRGGSSVPQAMWTNLAIAPGASIEVQLRFFPTRAMPGAHQGLLVIDNDVTNPPSGGAPLTVPLRGEGTLNSQQTDVFQQLRDNKIDILWVVDDSCSMSEEQAALASNFASFIGFADQLNVDYQVGVTTTEVNDAVSGTLWACNGYNRILTRNDPNRVAAFQCAANVTSPPGGNRRPNPGGSDEAEAGLQAARIALDVPVVNAQNQGFLRPDARLAVILVSDEEDQSDGSVNLYVDFFRQLKGIANPQLVSVSAISGDVPGGCATAEEGRRYYDAVRQLNGQFESICSNSWQQMLQNIGLGVFSLRQAWGLSRPADPATITVRVNGASVPQNATNGWTYDAASNTVTFRGSAVPPPGARIEVQYGSLCLP